MDDAKKKAGVPHSLSRNQEKANKRNTDKKRRQLGQKETRQRSATMETFDLMQQLQAELDAEKARQNPPPPAEENPFAKAEEVARQLGLTEDATPNPASDIARLAKHYKGKKMSKDQMRNAIGNDLEQLEYSPAQVSKMVSKVLALCCTE